jgi:hypothetical protein
VKQGPFWEATSQEINSLFWDPEVHLMAASVYLASAVHSIDIGSVRYCLAVQRDGKHPITLSSILILFSCLCLGLSLFPLSYLPLSFLRNIHSVTWWFALTSKWQPCHVFPLLVGMGDACTWIIILAFRNVLYLNCKSICDAVKS